MDCLARLAFFTIAKHDDVEQRASDESRLLKHLRHCRQVLPSNEQINVTCIAYCSFIDRRNPGCHRVSPGHRIKDARLR